MIPKTKPIKRANIITIFLNIPISVLVFVLKTGMAIIAIKTKQQKNLIILVSFQMRLSEDQRRLL